MGFSSGVELGRRSIFPCPAKTLCPLDTVRTRSLGVPVNDWMTETR